MTKNSKRGLDEWIEAIDHIYSCDTLCTEFRQLETRSDADAFAKKHKMKGYIINRLSRERRLCAHYYQYFAPYIDPSNAASLIESHVLKEEMKKVFFITPVRER